MDNVLLITGASTGIGAETARAAAGAGWRVGLVARSRDKLEALAEESGPDRAEILPCDVADAAAQQEAVDAVVARWGRLDAAFANAGLGATAPGFAGGELSNWRDMIEVNVWGLIATCKAAMGELRKTRGHMLLTGSRAGRRTMKGSVYSATKHFVHGFAANLEEEMREWGGRCTVIAPGMVDTPFFDDPKPDALAPADVAQSVVWALSQPRHVAVGEIYLTPNPG